MSCVIHRHLRKRTTIAGTVGVSREGERIAAFRHCYRDAASSAWRFADATEKRRS
jgi:hypothetical protein